MAVINALEGIKEVVYIRRYSKRSTVKGKVIPLQTNHELEKEFESDTTKTKTLDLVRVSKPTYSLTLDMVASDDALLAEIEEGVDAAERFELWIVDTSVAKSSNKYGARYAIGKFTSWSESADVEDFKTISADFESEGRFVKGDVTLTVQEIAEITEGYKFASLDVANQ